MKTKKFKQKLSLQKTTVANLNNPEMNNAKGGTGNPPMTTTDHPYCPDTRYPCDTCDNCTGGPSCQTIILSCTPDYTHTCM
jgi:hypothetical protein